jgi:dihydrofolate synthase/folylpolyglutamate synthase
VIDHWCVADLPSPRSAKATDLVARLATLRPAGAKSEEFSATAFANPGEAFASAISRAGESDRIVVFGSFYTVAGVMAARKNSLH